MHKIHLCFIVNAKKYHFISGLPKKSHTKNKFLIQISGQTITLSLVNSWELHK